MIYQITSGGPTGPKTIPAETPSESVVALFGLRGNLGAHASLSELSPAIVFAISYPLQPFFDEKLPGYVITQPIGIISQDERAPPKRMLTRQGRQPCVKEHIGYIRAARATGMIEGMAKGLYVL